MPALSRTRMRGAAPLLTAALLLVAGPAAARDYLPHSPATAGRSYSPGVVTTGGKIVWLAGVTTLVDEKGVSLAGDFEGQTRYIFREIERQLAKAGGTLADVVKMTVFMTDPRNGGTLAKVRSEVFPARPPASSQITISQLAVPGFLIEVECTAVIGDAR